MGANSKGLGVNLPIDLVAFDVNPGMFIYWKFMSTGSTDDVLVCGNCDVFSEARLGVSAGMAGGAARFAQVIQIPQAEKVVVLLSWPQGEKTDFTLTSPSGTVIDPSYVAAHPDKAAYKPKVVDAWYALVRPEPGAWTVTLTNPAVTTYTVTVNTFNEAPSLILTSPAARQTTRDTVQIAYTGSDPDGDDVTVSLYYGAEKDSPNGVLIASGLPASGAQVWDTAGLAAGTYWIYGTADDGRNSPVFAYAPGHVVVRPEQIPAAPGNLTATEQGDAVLLSWTAAQGAEIYQLQFVEAESANAVSQRLPLGASTELLVDTELPRGKAFRVTVAGETMAGARGSSSNEVVVELPRVTTDGTPPRQPTVRAPGRWTESSSRLFATWDSEDAESGVEAYQYCVGQSMSTCDVKDWSETAERFAEITELSLQSGVDYFIHVRAKNGAGAWSETGSSDPIGLLRGVAISRAADTTYQGIAAGGAAAVVLEVDLVAAPSAGDARLVSLLVHITGEAGAEGLIKEATLYQDFDRDGRVEARSSRLGLIGQVENGGFLRFDNIGYGMSPGLATRAVVTITLRSGAPAGSSLQASVVLDEDVKVVSAASGTRLSVDGAPVLGPTLGVLAGEGAIVPLGVAGLLLAQVLIGGYAAATQRRRRRRRRAQASPRVSVRS
ncbi:MAG: hypothetical protein HYV63_14460 [Candidatus Schekmanbacteria bacterium]|nr:hypothetical protein [Candidatus Schekmanbacteria bacterium]